MEYTKTAWQLALQRMIATFADRRGRIEKYASKKNSNPDAVELMRQELNSDMLAFQDMVRLHELLAEERLKYKLEAANARIRQRLHDKIFRQFVEMMQLDGELAAFELREILKPPVHGKTRADPEGRSIL